MSVPDIAVCDVEAAVAEIEKEGVPKTRRSTKFCLTLRGRHYPPKYVVALAVRHATRKTLAPADHSGGVETNSRLATLGLRVVDCSCGGLTGHT
jgi:hypothetical protein